MVRDRSGHESFLERHRKYVTLTTALVVAISAGTNYVYSAYAPQLAARLDLTSTQTNLIGIAGNFGNYLSAPVTGALVDKKGPRLAFLLSSFLLLLGYGFIYLAYTGTFATSSHLVAWAAIFMFLTGAGSSSGMTAGLNSTARTFSDKARGSATGLVLAGFGLSAFFYSTLSHSLFAESTADFLLMLALLPSLTMLLGVLLIRRPVRPGEAAEENVVHEGYERVDTDDGGESEREAEVEAGDDELERGRDLNSSRIRLVRSRSLSDQEIDDPKKRDKEFELLVGTGKQDISGWKLLKTWDFWLLASYVGLLSGIGLMYINNVGTMAFALIAQNHSKDSGQPDFDHVQLRKIQARQVAIVSICNGLGRFAIGFASDQVKNRFYILRVWFLVLVAFAFFTTQVVTSHVTQASGLDLCSILLGLSYGALFGILPVLSFEWFGIKRFSQNLGITLLSIIVGGNIFSQIFGRTYDSHVASQRLPLPPSSSSPTKDCFEGAECYVSVFGYTEFACCVAAALAVGMGFRREVLVRNEKRRVFGARSGRMEEEEGART